MRFLERRRPGAAELYFYILLSAAICSLLLYFFESSRLPEKDRSHLHYNTLYCQPRVCAGEAFP